MPVPHTAYHILASFYWCLARSRNFFTTVLSSTEGNAYSTAQQHTSEQRGAHSSSNIVKKLTAKYTASTDGQHMQQQLRSA